jgi:hypothetical protein
LIRAATLLTALATAYPELTGAPVLEFPLDCVLGQTCYIEGYVDLNLGNGISDYRCGLKTREGHKGIDIGLLSAQQMMRGVYRFMCFGTHSASA